MSSHAKSNLRSRRRGLGAVIGAALLLGGGFATQAVADSGEKKASPVAPEVVTEGKPAGESRAPKAVAEGKAPKVVAESRAPKAVAEGAPAAESKAPKVISEGKPTPERAVTEARPVPVN
ncbi:hypothetical protein ACFRMN_26005 [Streptomyces sp. NPDC056835]|uniref:hypothetical protein n=1 Tax=Streptomyces sp. NPDC056835 TaxID=3345956 RepID=UPI0036AE6AB0